LVVDAQRLPAATVSPFMATHEEQPDATHSRPASMKILSSPSASAIAFTKLEPGDTRPGTFTRLPRKTAAALLMSSIRPLVHDPRKT